MNSTAGSYALLGAQAGESTISEKLRAAGVIVLGKSNLSEWSKLRSVNETSGWSGRGGQTLGAYVANQDPQRSSFRSAVGVSVGLAWAALSVETFRGLIVPASESNIVGIKPSVGLALRHLSIGAT